MAPPQMVVTVDSGGGEAGENATVLPSSDQMPPTTSHFGNRLRGIFSLVNQTNMTVCDYEYEKFFEAASQFTAVTVILVIVVGLVTNTLSFSVFLTRDMVRRSASRYLLVLSCSDNLYLLTEFCTTWFTNVHDVFDVEILNHAFNRNVILCKVIKYLGTASRFISSWIIVTFTIERAIATYSPFRYATSCSLKRTNISVLLTTTVGILCIYPLFYADVIHEAGERRCTVSKEDYNEYKTFTYAFVVLVYVIPLLVILVMNILIAYKLKRSSHFTIVAASSGSSQYYPRRQPTPPPVGPRYSEVSEDNETVLIGSYSRSFSSGSAAMATATATEAAYQLNGSRRSAVSRQQSGGDSRAEKDRKITVNLMVVSTCFLLLNFPYIISWSVVASASFCSRYYELKKGMFKLFQTLHILNYSINFFLYCVTGRLFRKQLARLLCRACWSGGNTASGTRRNDSAAAAAANSDAQTTGFPPIGSALQGNGRCNTYTLVSTGHLLPGNLE